MLCVYDDCQRRSNDDIKGNCWKCEDLDLCSSCKVMYCTNSEKEEMIQYMKGVRTIETN